MPLLRGRELVLETGGEPDLTRPTGGRSDEMTLLPGHAALVAFHLAAGG
jgi:hypothetical protein